MQGEPKVTVQVVWQEPNSVLRLTVEFVISNLEPLKKIYIKKLNPEAKLVDD